MEAAVRALFKRYECFFNQAINNKADMDEIASAYASEFIAASPVGVMTGKNDDTLKHVMQQGYAHYRAIGAKEMRVQDLLIAPLDTLHCLAHVHWKSTYVGNGRPDVAIEFDVHYLVQNLDGEPKIFGWVTGDEQVLLKQHDVG